MQQPLFDALEGRSPEAREAALMAALPQHIAHAQHHAPAFAALLRGVEPGQVNSRAALAQLPVVRKSELQALQEAAHSAAMDAGAGGAGAAVPAGAAAVEDFFGGFATVARGRAMPRVFASPGPIFEPEGRAPDYWRMARAMYAAGFRAGDLIHNAFSYHFVPAGSMMESGAHALGCSVFPAGTGQTEQQVQAMRVLRPAGYIGTPSFLKIILEKAREMGVTMPGQTLPGMTKALFGGEAYPPSLRDWFLAHGIEGYQCYATADLGLIAYETQARKGLVVDENVIVEIVRPGTGDPVAPGEVGEVVVTSLNPDYPLIRFGTGDLSAVLDGMCPTGRTNTRIKGWMGRADQTTKVRGMFVHPKQVDAVVRRFPEVQRARLVVSGEMANDVMTLEVELSAGTPDYTENLVKSIGEAVRDVTKLRSGVTILPAGSLPNDGKVIADTRNYQ